MVSSRLSASLWQGTGSGSQCRSFGNGCVKAGNGEGEGQGKGEEAEHGHVGGVTLVSALPVDGASGSRVVDTVPAQDIDK